MRNTLLLIIVIGSLVGGYYLFSRGDSDTGLAISVGQSGSGPTDSTLPSGDLAKEPTELIELIDGRVSFEADQFSDGQATFYSTKLSSGIEVEYFVVQDTNGIYRAAANACQVCYDTKLGFHQEGDEMVCNTCGNRYPLTKIATEKGGCNPGPISPNLEVVDGQIYLSEGELAQVENFF